MANLDAFSNLGGNPQAGDPPGTKVPPEGNKPTGNSFEWGEVPTTKYIIVETTLSGASFKAPQPKVTGASKTLANLWPGKLHWTEAKKGGIRLFSRLSAMALNRTEDGVPVLDKEDELTWKEGIQVTLCEKGLTRDQKATIAQLEGVKKENPAMAAAVDASIATIKAQSGWVTKKLDGRSFVTGVCDSGDTILPVTIYINMNFGAKVAQEFVKEVAKLGDKPAILRFFIPVTRLVMPKTEFKPVKVKTAGGGLPDLKHPKTGQVIEGPEFSWGGRTQPISRIEISAPGMYLESSEGMDRVLSEEESERRVNNMKRSWEEDQDDYEALKKWEESFKGKFSSQGNRWAHKAGALPKIKGGKYAETCQMWQDAAESQAKLHRWSEVLRAMVGEKPRLNEENQPGNSTSKFSSQACEAIISCAEQQSIKPWVAFVASLKGENAPAPQPAPTPAPEPTPEPTPAPAPQPESTADESDEPSQEELLAAILARREAESLEDLEDDDEDFDVAGFLGGSVQE